MSRILSSLLLPALRCWHSFYCLFASRFVSLNIQFLQFSYMKEISRPYYLFALFTPPLSDRLGSCAFFLLTSYLIFLGVGDGCFSSFPQVVEDSVENTRYVVQNSTVCTVVCAVALGMLIFHIRRCKTISLHERTSLSIFGLSLMVYFRKPDDNIAYTVTCQISISIAFNIIIVYDEISNPAATSHQSVAVSFIVLLS